jgi:glutamine cyclotransferase
VQDRKLRSAGLAAVGLIALIAISATECFDSTRPLGPTDHTFEVIQVFPHDMNAFTQGLVIDDGILYEGTGLYGQSSLRRVDLESGEVLDRINLDAAYFGEGITTFDDRIIQLTWREHKGFVYDQESFTPLEEFSYTTEGWGLTHDGTHLILSDGTNILYFLDPETFAVVSSVGVFDEGTPVTDLNELEYIHGEVYANVWEEDFIVRINPETGEVVGRIILDGLLESTGSSLGAGVLNGIAYDAEADRLFVTGKRWPSLFEIRLVPVEE